MTSSDVIIIGAGIAGLTAAHWLSEYGYRVLVLEAKNDIGGQIHTLYKNDSSLEIGANCLVNVNPTQDAFHPLLTYFKGASLNFTPLDPRISAFFDPMGKPATFSSCYTAAKNYYEKSFHQIQSAKKTANLPFPTLEDLLPFRHHTPAVTTPAFFADQTLHAMITHHTGTTAHKVSLYELMNAKETIQKTFLIQGGLQALPQLIARKAVETNRTIIKINTPIQQVYYGDPKKSRVIDCHGKVYRAPCIISTVPMGVLKKEKIAFHPPLSTPIRGLIRHLEVGYQNKVFLEFDKPFWPSDVHYLFPGSQKRDEWPEYLNLHHFSPTKTPTLAAIFYAKSAQFSNKSDALILKTALNPLQRIYQQKVSTLKAFYITRWDSDPYTLGGGGTCYGTQIKPADLAVLTKPETGDLFFAGASFATQNRDTLEAALRSGLEAAVKVAATLRRTAGNPLFGANHPNSIKLPDSSKNRLYRC